MAGMHGSPQGSIRFRGKRQNQLTICVRAPCQALHRGGESSPKHVLFIIFLETLTMERHRTHISSAVEEARDEESPDKVWM